MVPWRRLRLDVLLLWEELAVDVEVAKGEWVSILLLWWWWWWCGGVVVFVGLGLARVFGMIVMGRVE